MKKVILVAVILILFQACGTTTYCSTKPTKRSGWIVNR